MTIKILVGKPVQGFILFNDYSRFLAVANIFSDMVPPKTIFFAVTDQPMLNLSTNLKYLKEPRNRFRQDT
jgi:hypothetical protein